MTTPKSEPTTERTTLLYRGIRRFVRTLLQVVYRFRADGFERVPSSGPVLLVANHVSFFDPPLVACGLVARPVHFLARASLFKWPLGPLITALNSIPLDDNAGDLRAIRRVIDHLKQGEMVLIFPEGSRTYDGKLQPFRDGVRLIVRKAGCPVIPIAIEGGFDTWPRTRAVPRLFGCRLRIRYGDPIPASALGGGDANETIERVIDGMRLELRSELRSRSNGAFPKAGPGDEPLHADG